MGNLFLDMEPSLAITLLTDLYNPLTDDISFDDLLTAGIVSDLEGKVSLSPPTPEELKLIHCQTIGLSTMSGRGWFHAWKSSMQKGIRRCKIEDTLVAVVECCGLGGQFVSNIVNRLFKVIISEDIGPADPLLTIECWKFVHDYESAGKCKIGEVLDPIMQGRILDLVYRLITARKSRLVCNLLCAIKLPDELDYSIGYRELVKCVFDMDLEGSVKNALICEKSKTPCKTVIVGGLSRRRAVYKVWQYLLDESAIDPVLEKINYSLYMLYDRAGEECSLLLAGAVVNIILWNKLDPRELIDKCPYTWKELESMLLYPMAVAYDQHVGEAHGKIDIKGMFWGYGSKISNRYPPLEYLDDLYYTRCVGKSDFHL